jgi:hypothetical protein
MSEATENGDAGSFSIIGERAVPETYADSVAFEASQFGVTLVFGKGQQAPPNFKGRQPTVPRFRVHMSPQHFKVMTLTMRRLLKDYESGAGHINLAKGTLESLDLEDTSEEDPSS